MLEPNKTGEIIDVDKKKLRAKVKDVNMVKKHIKTTKEKKGGIVTKEDFIDLSNLKIDQENKKNKDGDKKK